MNVTPVRLSSVSSFNQPQGNKHKPSFGMKLTSDSERGLSEYRDLFWEDYSPQRIKRVFNMIDKIDSGNTKLKLVGVEEYVANRYCDIGFFTTTYYTEYAKALVYRFVDGNKESDDYYCEDTCPEAFYAEVESDLEAYKHK